MKFSLLPFAFLLIIFLTSCQDNEVLDETVLLQNTETFIQGIESENFITIRVESLADTSDDRGGEINTNDYCNISFDINSNNQIDADIDFGYESPTSNYDICSYYFLEADAITHCGGHPTTATFTESFAASSEKSIPHMIWELTIPKEELDYTRKLSFTVKTIDKGVFRTHPPISRNENPILFTFKETLTFNW